MPIRQSVCLPMFLAQDADRAHIDATMKEIKAIGLEAVETWGRGKNFDDIVEADRKSVV
jgi:hypothetical protein